MRKLSGQGQKARRQNCKTHGTRSVDCAHPQYPADVCTQSMSLDEAQVLTLKTLKQVMEEKLDENNVELAVVTPTTSFRILKKDELKTVIDKIETSGPEDGDDAAGAASTTAAAPDGESGSGAAPAEDDIPAEAPMS